VFLEGTLPEAFSRVGPESLADTMNGRIFRLNERVRSQPQLWSRVRERMAALQEAFDTECEEVQIEGAALKGRGERIALENLTTSFMQRNLEEFDSVLTEFGVRMPVALAPAMPMFEY
jgi:hypothetical protein